jgi:uncharacterized protein
VSDQAPAIAALPVPLRWQGSPARWRLDGDALAITAGAGTDLFADPLGTAPVLNAPRLLGTPAGDFQLSARVTVDFRTTFDAGVLLLHAGERAWAKLCFERSPQGEPLVVSVVTRGVSDDCNSFAVDGGAVWLRVARLGPAFAFHASTDGAAWRLVRWFALDAAGPVAAGFLAQSPGGQGCTATFEAIRYLPERLHGLRDGS